jgi:hypothetical protein
MPSSVIRNYSYYPRERELRVTFVSGQRYAYLDVPPAIHEGLRAASSRGRFFSARIRDRFAFRKEGDGEAARRPGGPASPPP